MEIIRSISVMQKIKRKYPHLNIGFVPTMGYLHAGHLSLVKQAKKENDILIMSIFVNPLQFGPGEDFDTYPRDEKRDSSLAEEAGVDYLFYPDVNEMYPNDIVIEMKMKDRIDVLCGASRPGHFDGVITVLTKLFHIIQPTKAYFGLKDAQQLAVIDSLITDLNFPITLIGVSTKREADGLAMSSRNVYLSDQERQEAKSLYEALNLATELINDGILESRTIIAKVKEYLMTHTTGKIDYVSLLSYPNLKHVEKIDQQVIIAVAVYFKRARLIDNIIVNEQGKIIESFRQGG